MASSERGFARPRDHHRLWCRACRSRAGRRFVAPARTRKPLTQASRLLTHSWQGVGARRADATPRQRQAGVKLISELMTAAGLTSVHDAMTNLDLDDADDPRIRFVAANLEPADFPASAGRICRDDRIVIAGADRGTISSSLIVIGEEIGFEHILGDPRGRDYQRFRLPDAG